jgi:hypothetical protein
MLFRNTQEIQNKKDCKIKTNHTIKIQQITLIQKSQ